MNDELMEEFVNRITNLERRLEHLEVVEIAPVVAHYKFTGTQTVTTGAAAARVNYDSKTIDTHSAVTTGASWVFDAPIAGYYFARAVLMFDSSSAWDIGDATYLTLTVGDATHRTYLNNVYDAGSAIFLCLNTHCVGYCAVNDDIHATIYQASGSDIDIYTGGSDTYYTNISIFKIGG